MIQPPDNDKIQFGARHAQEAWSLEIPDCVKNNDLERLIQILKSVTNQYKFKDVYITLIYDYFIDMGEHEYALKYISDAIKYLTELNKDTEDLIKRKRIANKKGMCERLKTTLLYMHDLSPNEIPQVVPDSINSQFTLHEFLIEEILRGLNIMRDKIVAVESIKHENKYNDVFLATLRLRFPIWGWDITDQPRLGRSPGGVEAGEIDVLITATGSNITFIEAFRLDGQDFNVVNDHLSKCADYVKSVDHYYIIIYFIGKKDKFEKYWKVYLSDVEKVEFPTELEYDKATPYEDVTKNYKGTSGVKIATTKHGTEKFMHHIMVNLGEDT